MCNRLYALNYGSQIHDQEAFRARSDAVILQDRESQQLQEINSSQCYLINQQLPQ